jgi:hypothetical protein
VDVRRIQIVDLRRPVWVVSVIICGHRCVRQMQIVMQIQSVHLDIVCQEKVVRQMQTVHRVIDAFMRVVNQRIDVIAIWIARAVWCALMGSVQFRAVV